MTTAAEHAVLLQAASVLLRYPDAAHRQALPVVVRALESLPAGPSRDHLLRFARSAVDRAPSESEQHYVETFDRKRRCSPYLTWWTDGETRRRGLSLARLKALYREYGFELTGTELPDFLPVVLEFGAQADVPACLGLLQDHRPGVELLRLALRDLGTPYVDVLTAVCALLPGPSPADEAAARALARTGPPDEAVGLDGYAAASGPVPVEIGVRR